MQDIWVASEAGQPAGLPGILSRDSAERAKTHQINQPALSSLGVFRFKLGGLGEPGPVDLTP